MFTYLIVLLLGLVIVADGISLNKLKDNVINEIYFSIVLNDFNPDEYTTMIHTVIIDNLSPDEVPLEFKEYILNEIKYNIHDPLYLYLDQRIKSVTLLQAIRKLLSIDQCNQLLDISESSLKLLNQYEEITKPYKSIHKEIIHPLEKYWTIRSHPCQNQTTQEQKRFRNDSDWITREGI